VVVVQDSSCGACVLHSALMATASLGRPSPCVVVGRGGVVGGRVAATAARLPRRGSFCKLRCSVEESDVSHPSAVDVAPPTIDLEILGVISVSSSLQSMFRLLLAFGGRAVGCVCQFLLL
jgi:hypothetical protein